MAKTETREMSKYTALVWRVFSRAQRVALEFGQDFVTNGHVLVALVETPGLANVVLAEAGVSSDTVRAELQSGEISDAEALSCIGIDLEGVKQQLEDAFGTGVLDTDFPSFTELTTHALSLAQEEAQALGHDFVGTEHLLLGLLRQEEGPPSVMLRRFDLELSRLREVIAERVARVIELRRAVDTAPSEIELHRLVSSIRILPQEQQQVGRMVIGELWTEAMAAWGELLKGLVASTDDALIGEYLARIDAELRSARDRLQRLGLKLP